MAQIIKKEVIKVRNGNLKMLCSRKGITIAELSRNIDISEEALQKFNKGERTITFEKWIEVNKYLDSIECQK